MPYLYAVRMLIPGIDPQPIKVGYSDNPHKRRAAYKSGPYPCQWLGVWFGCLDDETAFHAHFADLGEGLAGEWFLPNDEFMRFINSKIEEYRRFMDGEVARMEEELRGNVSQITDEARRARELEDELFKPKIEAARIREEMFFGNSRQAE